MSNQQTTIDPAIVDFVRTTAKGDAYAGFFRDTLAMMATDKSRLLDLVQQKIKTLCPNAAIEHAPIDSGRAHLFVTTAGSGPQIGVVLQANVETLPQMALLLAQLKLTMELEAKFGPAQSSSVYQVIFGENSVANDPRFAAAPAVLFQPTDLQVCTGHVGVVNYRCKLSVGKNENLTAVELFPFVVLSLESEARRLKREAVAPGFDAAQVYSNHGVLGCYGHRPAAVCERVSIHLVTHTNANPERIAMKLTQFLEEASAEYVARYGPNASSSGSRHFSITVLPSSDAQNFRIDVFGQAGHPAVQTDNAISKAALLFGGLLKMADKYPGIQAYGRLADAEIAADVDRSIILQGLQTFSPTHRASDVQKRMTEAATDALKKYCKLRRRKFDASMIEMSFEGPNCEAKSPNENVSAQAFRSAATSLGQHVEGVKVWPMGCATTQSTPVAFFGPGRLSANQNDVVDIADLQKALATSVLATRALSSK